MNAILPGWIPPLHLLLKHKNNSSMAIPSFSGGNGGISDLSTRERRQLRQERRENKAKEFNWREEIEEKIIQESKKKKKKKPTRKEQLRVNDLAQLGAQWWILRVARSQAHDIAGRLARALSSNFPEIQFKLYYPVVRVKRKLKDGSLSVKLNPLCPGLVYLHGILNRPIHDFVKEFDGVGGFLGSEIEISKEQYFTKPNPVDPDEIEAIFQREKVEQENADKAFEEKEKGKKKKEIISKSELINQASLLPGVTVSVLSGPFAEYTGCIKELDLKKRKASVEFLLFGKESIVDLDFDQITAVNS